MVASTHPLPRRVTRGSSPLQRALRYEFYTKELTMNKISDEIQVVIYGLVLAVLALIDLLYY